MNWSRTLRIGEYIRHHGDVQLSHGLEFLRWIVLQLHPKIYSGNNYFTKGNLKSFGFHQLQPVEKQQE